MPFPVAPTQAFGTAPSPAYAGTFIPTLWSPRVLVKFYATTILKSITSLEVQRQMLSMGDTIVIPTIPNVVVQPYQAGAVLNIQQYGSTPVTMAIDRGQYAAVVVDTVYRVQSQIDLLRMFTSAIANQLRVDIERDVFAGLVGQEAPTNAGNAAGVISGAVRLGATGSPLRVTLAPSAANDVNPIHLLLRLNQVLYEQNVPPDGTWWVVIPPWFAQLLKPSDLKSAADMGDSRSVLRTGEIGRIDNLRIFVSNLLPTSIDGGKTVTHIFAGHPSAINFATQLSAMDTVPPVHTFGVVIRALQVYGFKATQRVALARAYAYGGL